MNAAAAVARVHANTVDPRETGATPTLVRRHAVAVVAALATRHASTSVSRRSVRGSGRLRDSFSDYLVLLPKTLHVDESVVALAVFRHDARTVVAAGANGLAAAVRRRVPVTPEARAEIRPGAGAVAAIDVADRLACERNARPVVTSHAIAVPANAPIGRLADPVRLAGRVTDGIARVRGACRLTMALVAAAHVGLHADAVPATRHAYGLAEARSAIALGRTVTAVAGAFVRRAAVPVDAVDFAVRFAHVRKGVALGEAIALVARASLRCAAEAVDASCVADRLARRVTGEISHVLKKKSAFST